MSSPVLPDAPHVDAPAVVVPDRADAPISEITERFFRALLLKVPLERIEELHLFSPLRQGGVETGIAVIAAREVVVLPVAEQPIADPELPLDSAPADIADDVVIEDVAIEDAVVEVAAAADVATEDVSAVDVAADDVADDVTIEDIAVENVAIEAIAEQPVIDESVSEPAPDAEIASAEGADADVASAALATVESASAPKVRHTVFTARYRLVQKGPERGKWEADVVAEAEAPLITVETVVRGVQRRAGEESDTTRFTAPQIARALRIDIGAA